MPQSVAARHRKHLTDPLGHRVEVKTRLANRSEGELRVTLKSFDELREAVQLQAWAWFLHQTALHQSPGPRIPGATVRRTDAEIISAYPDENRRSYDLPVLAASNRNLTYEGRIDDARNS